MEKRTFHNRVNVKYSKDLFSKYAQRIEHINKLTLGKHFDEAIENCNLLIDDIKLKHMINNTQKIANAYTLLKYCMGANKKNYQAWFDTVFEALSQQPNTQQDLSSFIKRNFNQAINFMSKKCYLQAIGICSALMYWLNQQLSIGRLGYQIPLQKLLAQCNMVYEYIYFHWLCIEKESFMLYHYQDTDMSQKINKKYDEIVKYYLEKNYRKAADLCTIFNNNINEFSAKAFETVENLTLSWHKVTTMQRQKILFDWLIYHNDGLKLDNHSDYIEMLKDDLALIIEVSYFAERNKLKAQCRLAFINLLFQTSIKQDELCELKRKFCIAFDIFEKEIDNESIALVLFGFALINAYEGNKQEMLIGLRLVVQYDNKLENLTQTIIKHFPFYMERKANDIVVLVNPLIQINLDQKIQPAISNRK